VVRLYEFANHRVREPLILYAIPTQPLVESTQIVQELPVYPLFWRCVLFECLPNLPRIDGVGAECAELASDLIEISKYLKCAYAGIMRDVTIVSESRVEANPCWAHYQQKWNDVLVPDSAVYLAGFSFRFGLANVNDRYIPLRSVVGRRV
jgi:hypothetical protein